MQRFGFLLVCGLCLYLVIDLCQANGRRHTVVVLVGATGDLSSKYLWQAIFDTASHGLPVPKLGQEGQRSNHSFFVIGVARAPQNKGETIVKQKIEESIRCGGASSELVANQTCEDKKQLFIDNTAYVQLVNNDEDFPALCNHLQNKIPQAASETRVDIIMYMAIPTTAYLSFMKSFQKFCSQTLLQSPNLIEVRWALEKPFGMDEASASVFATELEKFVEESQVYHVDHYLHKPVVKAILDFRSLNPHLEKLWNNNGVERVEIFLKETLDVKGRADFYSSMGVLRDIHQNHLTQLLTLIAMELPAKVKDHHQVDMLKANLLGRMKSVKTSHALFGQYAGFADQMASQSANSSNTSSVPTYASVLMAVETPRWSGVPFLLVSGKCLDRRESYIRLVFKDNRMCVSQCHTEVKPAVVFHIGHGDLPTPAILVSKTLPRPSWPDGVVEVKDATIFKVNISVAHHAALDQWWVGGVTHDLPAYQSVVKDLVGGSRAGFVTTQHLLLSWRLWDAVVTGHKTPRTYQPGDIHGDLNFHYGSSGLEFDRLGATLWGQQPRQGHETSALFLGRKVVSGSSLQLAALLAADIGKVARDEVGAKGVFHMALSGGTSVSPLLKALSRPAAAVPWESVHIWQVDERCVPHHEAASNFGRLYQEMFQHVAVPGQNLHPMPVDVGGQLCQEELGGAHEYARHIQSQIPDGRFDWMLLGVGADGHTASLFPGSPALHVSHETVVTVTEDSPDYPARRMSLTLPMINRSKWIAVLATGSHKADIVRRLETSRSVDTHPILGVNPPNGTVTWYIDHQALSDNVDIPPLS